MEKRPRKNIEEYQMSERGRKEKLATRITSQKRKRDKNNMEVIEGKASSRSRSTNLDVTEK